MTMKLESTAFKHEGLIPPKYTCDGDDVSPDLTWSGVPDDTKSLALIMDDPDAPGRTFVHWLLFNMPADVSQLNENVPKDKVLPNGSVQGHTSFGTNGYGGPCPPGGIHRYYFKLYALDAMLDLNPDATKKDLLKAMESHVVSEVQLMGKYQRQ